MPSHAQSKTGILLVNLGTPDAPDPGPVRRFLAEFLSDPRVLDMPALGRFLLLHLVILRTRPRTSAAAYRKIWTKEGSPLLLHGIALRDAVAERLGEPYAVELAMRYGSPDIASALQRLTEAGVARIIIAPLYPQYSASTTGSAAARIFELAARRWDVPPMACIEPFYDDPRFIQAFSAVAAPTLEAFAPDFVLFSYHGLPERQIRKSDSSGERCLRSASCCDEIGPTNHSCYRAQCLATTRALAAKLELGEAEHTSSFQSRMGRIPWIEPHTDAVLSELAERGVRRLAVICPAFVADCLETLEEIAIRAREDWLACGGEELLLVPSLNAHPAWVEALSSILTECAGGPEA